MEWLATRRAVLIHGKIQRRASHILLSASFAAAILLPKTRINIFAPMIVQTVMFLDENEQINTHSGVFVCYKEAGASEKIAEITEK